ncbi:MAG: crotonase/enoyl-CoA hydratase family protein [Actinobacteria bacterium]|nr:crotonase/enoyl-CoA hydratase family protein [Actinomycetota bacterium]OJU83917.1 MAG: enoyl-CoA hydratase [Solirubrobacterales bacterium 70-9]
MSPQGDIKVSREGQVLVMVIDRPEVRNAVDGATSRALAEAVAVLEADPELRVGILTGAGGNFSSGMDLKAFLAGDSPDLAGRGIGGITTKPPSKPLIAAVEGWALAGGFEMVLACDLVVAARSARFGLPEVKRSLIAAGGGLIRLTRAIPRALAMEMILTGDPIDAESAAAAGLVNKLVADGEALTAALELAERIVANGPIAVEASKEIAVRSFGKDEEDAFASQAPVRERVLASEDAQEGLHSFVEKRPPRWRGV